MDLNCRFCLEQWFLNCGARPPRGACEVHKGGAKEVKISKKLILTRFTTTLLDSQLRLIAENAKPCMSALIRHNIFIFTKMLRLLQLNHNQSSDRTKYTTKPTEYKYLV